MRVFFIVVAVFAVVFFGIMGFAGDGNEPAPKDEEARRYEPHWTLKSIGNLAFYYPGKTYKLSGSPFLVSRARPVQVRIDAGTGTRLLKLQLVAGPAARAVYSCGSGCEKTLCLIDSDIDRPPGCERASDRGTILLEPAGGAIRIETTSFLPVRVTSR